MVSQFATVQLVLGNLSNHDPRCHIGSTAPLVFIPESHPGLISFRTCYTSSPSNWFVQWYLYSDSHEMSLFRCEGFAINLNDLTETLANIPCNLLVNKIKRQTDAA